MSAEEYTDGSNTDDPSSPDPDLSSLTLAALRLAQHSSVEGGPTPSDSEIWRAGHEYSRVSRPDQ